VVPSVVVRAQEGFCRLLQGVAVCCSVLLHGHRKDFALAFKDISIVCCSSMFALCCSASRFSRCVCSALQCFAVCCSALQCVAVLCSVLQCFAVCCSLLIQLWRIFSNEVGLCHTNR